MFLGLKFLKSVIRDYGLSWVLRRGFYEFQVRSGWHRLKLPQRFWDENELARWLPKGESSDPAVFFEHWKRERRRFFFEPNNRENYREHLKRILGPDGVKALVADAENIGKGEFTYFFKHRAELGFPPDWHLNPFTGGRADPKAHWTCLPMFSREYGDIKFIWEPGRFASAFLLARASWASGRDFAETFWSLVESWGDANPPNSGAHWKCGQEISLRLMAWYFGLHAFLKSPATTPERFAMLVGMAAAQAERVERDHVYSHLQQNNHAMSEGVGLYVTGLLFPQLNRAAHWRKRGMEILEEEGLALIKPEGTFRQKSHNYHRLMLHLYLYAGRLMELNGDSFTDALIERLRNAVDYLYQVQDDESGMVPNFGGNDGALIFPANSCDYQNYRPVCAAGHFWCYGMRLYPNGTWDEDLLWLFGDEALRTPIESPVRVDQARNAGGIYTLRGKDSWVFTHCESFKERPGQSDALHFDLWWRGLNLTPDPGSYLYFGEGPWRNGLAHTCCHSTVTVDGENQMGAGPRFMKTSWHGAKVRPAEWMGEGEAVYWEGEHDGYERLEDPVVHRRGIVRLAEDGWVVIDDVVGRESHRSVLHLLLADLPFTIDENVLRFETPKGHYFVKQELLYPLKTKIKLERERGGEESAPRGWLSHYYGDKSPALSIRAIFSGPLPCRYITIFSPEKGRIKRATADGSVLSINIGESIWQLQVARVGVRRIVSVVKRNPVVQNKNKGEAIRGK